jgi:hypothetical protein
MQRHTLVLSFLVIAAAAAAACGPSSSGNGGDDDDSGDDDGGDGNADVDAWVPPPDDGDGGTGDDGCEKIDILFVVDNSGSMGEEQTNLATNFPQFLTLIEASGLDWRVAITTTGMDYTYNQETFPGLPPIPISQDGGDNGAMLQPSGCNMTRRWIAKNDANAAQSFACAANVGTGGPSDEMPLAAMRAAFDERVTDGTNAGFRREDALLAVVFLTDENDCSYEQPITLPFAQSFCESMTEPAANYVAFLDTFTGDRGRWAAAAIAGPGPGACTSTFGSADFAERLQQFVTGAGPATAVMSSICAGDLTIGLMDALALFDTACENFPPID